MNEPTRDNNSKTESFSKLVWNYDTIITDRNGNIIKGVKTQTNRVKESEEDNSKGWYKSLVNIFSRGSRWFDLNMGWFFRNGNK